MFKYFIWIISVFLLAAAPAGASASSATTLVKKEITTTLLSNLPWDRGEAEITDIEVPGLTDGEYRFDRASVELPDRMRTTGKVSVYVHLISGHTEVKGLWASARIRVFRDAVVAVAPLRINHRITEDEIKVVRTDVTSASGLAVSLREVAGMLVRRPIQAGEPIKKSYLKQVKVIKRGDPVVITVENDRLRIVSRGTAMENGSVGSTIALKMASGKTVRGEVTGPGEVTVNF